MPNQHVFKAISLVLVTSIVCPTLLRAADAGAGAPGPAGGAASSATADAQQRFERGNAHYNLGEWDAAIEDYRAAYLLDTQPKFLWAIAQAQRLKGDCDAAIKTYQAFKRTGPSEDVIARADGQIKACELALKNRPTPATSTSAPVTTSSASVAAPAVASVPPASPTAPPRSPQDKPGAWYGDGLGNGLFWTGIVAAGVGGTVLIRANREMSSAASAADYGTWHSTTERTPTMQALGVVGLVAGGALIGLGVWRFVTVANRSGRTESTVGIAVGPGSITMGGSF